MAVSNSKDNLFWYSEEFIEVRKDVLVEDKTPLIIRDWDEVVLWANLFNTTKKTIWFKVKFESDELWITGGEREVVIDWWDNEFVTWKVINNKWKQKVNYKITILWDSVDHSDKLEWSIEVKESPVLIQNNLNNGSVAKWEKKTFSLKVPENTDIEKSKYELYISNNPLSGIEKIIYSLLKYPYGCIEQSVSSTLPNAILLNFIDLLEWVDISKAEAEKNLEAWIERIKSMQTDDGWFWYWQWDSESNLRITPFVLRSLIDMRKSGWLVSDKMIRDATTYLQTNYDKAESETNKAEIFWALSKAWANPTISIKREELDRHALIAYTYGLVLKNNDINNTIIDQNIETIKSKLLENTSSWYWNSLSDKAIFTSMLIDYNYDEWYIWALIKDLYNTDWSSYYYSTQTKNNSFSAFVKYIEKYWKDNNNDISISLNWKSKDFKILWVKNSYKSIVDLSEVLNGSDVNLEIENKTNPSIFVSAILKSYPQDKLKVKPYSNWVSIKREIYEVVDDTKLNNRCTWISWNYECNNSDWLKLHTSDVFEKWKTYKIKLTARFDDDKRRTNLTIEDYLPASFRILNSKFKTTSTSISQNTTTNWTWRRVENNPWVVMANAEHFWWKTAVYEYFVSADFEWSFTYPPATTYLMYDPQIRANTQFRNITVK